MTACKQKIHAFERSLQIIEEFVKNGSLHVSEKSFNALYNTYEVLIDMTPVSDDLRINNSNVNDSLFSSKNSSSPGSIHKDTEKRLHQRVQLDGYRAGIIQGGFAYTASVKDVSLQGIQLHDLPTRFYSIQKEKFTVVIFNMFDSIHYNSSF